MYRTIETSIWYDPKVKKLNLQEKLLFFYLVTNHHAHMSGIYYISLHTISDETSISIDDLKRAFRTLASVTDLPDNTLIDTPSIPYRYPIDGGSQSGLAYFDYDFQVVWVKNMLQHQGKGEKVKKGVENHLKTLHKCPLINYLREYYLSIGWGDIHTPSIPYRYPIDGGSVQEQEQEQEQEQKSICRLTHVLTQDGDAKNLNSAKTTNRFEEFWKLYPRKEKKKQSQEIWKRKKLDEKADFIITDVSQRKQRHQTWKDGFIPHASTYLNGERWNDEITEQSNGEGKRNMQTNGRYNDRSKSNSEKTWDFLASAAGLTNSSSENFDDIENHLSAEIPKLIPD